ncbi:adenine nucleotide alpha hydrolases-like superfamily protein [Actinidia rufa]|uniref:Adenine nucleotide alpha hydrolases-like superfamily protein n=1 Tax=Actinidia rufa TaxID=165716 RepID=A0A7J0ERZ0_9ERIC|nr:adenine nucleotide alpha hydrolases-like superfamily protein [Actinidia rufa]
MGRTGVKLSGFCLNRIRPHVRVRSPPIQSKLDDQKTENSGCVGEENLGVGKKSGEWALTHTVQSQDMVILLYVTKPSKQGEESSKEIAPRVSEFLQSMKKICQTKRPEVKIEVAVAEGKEKGPTIVEETKKQGVALLILGQKKHSMTWRFLMTWARNRVGGGVVEYCIQNATCMALAVRRKSKKLGGYLITTKRHKDFWLLA